VAVVSTLLVWELHTGY